MTAPAWVYAAGDASPPLVVALTRNGAAVDLTGRTATAIVDRSSAGLPNLQRNLTVLNPVTSGQVALYWVPGDLENPSPDGTTVYYLVDIVLDFGLATQETMPTPVTVAVRSTASSVFGGIEPAPDVPEPFGGETAGEGPVGIWRPYKRPVHVIARYAAEAFDQVLADSSAGAFPVDLPTGGRPGDEISVRVIAGAGVVSVDVASGSVDGAASVNVGAAGTYGTWTYDGAQWWRTG